MRNIIETIRESLSENMSKRDLTKDNITEKDLKDAYFASSFMDDNRSFIKVDGDSYTKIKKDTWEKYTPQAHAFNPTYSSKELLDIIKKSKEVDLSEINFK